MSKSSRTRLCRSDGPPALQVATPAILRRYREVILKQRPSMNYRELIEFMAREHLIRVTTDMLKKRLRAWNSTPKYNREQEMRAITILADKLEKAGHTNMAFKFQDGRIITQEKRIEYWRRKNKSVQQVIKESCNMELPTNVRAVPEALLKWSLESPEEFASVELMLKHVAKLYKGYILLAQFLGPVQSIRDFKVQSNGEPNGATLVHYCQSLLRYHETIYSFAPTRAKSWAQDEQEAGRMKFKSSIDVFEYNIVNNAVQFPISYFVYCKAMGREDLLRDAMKSLQIRGKVPTASWISNPSVVEIIGLLQAVGRDKALTMLRQANETIVHSYVDVYGPTHPETFGRAVVIAQFTGNRSMVNSIIKAALRQYSSANSCDVLVIHGRILAGDWGAGLRGLATRIENSRASRNSSDLVDTLWLLCDVVRFAKFTQKPWELVRACVYTALTICAYIANDRRVTESVLELITPWEFDIEPHLFVSRLNADHINSNLTDLVETLQTTSAFFDDWTGPPDEVAPTDVELNKTAIQDFLGSYAD